MRLGLSFVLFCLLFRSRDTGVKWLVHRAAASFGQLPEVVVDHYTVSLRVLFLCLLR